MDLLCLSVLLLSGGVFGLEEWISESKVTVTRGDNITLYCDCELKTGVYIVWYRNCSHENQPTLIMGLRSNSQIGKWEDNINGYFNRFKLVKNDSSNTYDLLITNITDSEEGLYYCGTENTEVKDEEHITLTYVKRFGNTTRIILDRGKPEEHAPPICWILLFSLCPLFAAFSSLCSSLLIYHLCRRRGFQSDRQSPDTGGERSPNKDEDVCYAALDIRQPSQRPKRKKENSEFSTYSAINTSRM
ncbi:uncharacterized protein LOC115390542 [Salarias fasciatus]|uniref:uncharacterized protein LOC115390542 n=1 Tax=Salarias fasciatus TaxID=181472 RepID=UPI001176E1BB|nr:uncharacterized protein LOC115390542 [Salarias fasciatus]